MNKSTAKLDKAVKAVNQLKKKFRKHVCRELGWGKKTFKKKVNNIDGLSPFEASTIMGIGWEFADELYREISS